MGRTGRFGPHDLAYMRRAIVIARRGLGRVEPNPMVGCLIVRGGRVISEGYHHCFGGAHAEIEALRAAGRSVRGATVYVTLEPCCHHGKTPPCTDALIDAGVRRVVAAMTDPSKNVAGSGFRRLRTAGIDVDTGCLRNEARTLNEAYLTRIKHGRPWVILKWAQSLDGRLSPAAGSSRRISGADARRWVHRLRSRVDGIIVGVTTVRADDPRLTARGVRPRRVATRIVLDSHLRTPATSCLVRSARDVPTLILTTSSALACHRRRAQRIEARGARVEGCRARAGRVDAADALRRLGTRGMTNVMVEGGPTILRELLRRDLADEAFVIVAPRLLGGVENRAFPERLRGPAAVVTTRRLAGDILYHVRFRASGVTG